VVGLWSWQLPSII